MIRHGCIKSSWQKFLNMGLTTLPLLTFLPEMVIHGRLHQSWIYDISNTPSCIAIATHRPRAGRWFHTAVRIISTEQPTSERMEGKILWSQIVPADWKYQTSRPTAPRLEGPTHLLLKISAMCSPLPKGGLHKGLHKLWG